MKKEQKLLNEIYLVINHIFVQETVSFSNAFSVQTTWCI